MQYQVIVSEFWILMQSNEREILLEPVRCIGLTCFVFCLHNYLVYKAIDVTKHASKESIINISMVCRYCVQETFNC